MGVNVSGRECEWESESTKHKSAHTHAHTHSPTHSLLHSFTHSLTHSLLHSFTPSLTHSLTPSLTPSLTHSLTHSLLHPLYLLDPQAGAYVQEEGLAEIVQILAEHAAFHCIAVRKLYAAIARVCAAFCAHALPLHSFTHTHTHNMCAHFDLSCLIPLTHFFPSLPFSPPPSPLSRLQGTSAQPLLQCAAWCIGEFARDLVAGGPVTAGDGDGDELTAVNSGEVIKVLHRMIQDPTNSNATHHYALNALAKMSTRVPEQEERIRNIVRLCCVYRPLLPQPTSLGFFLYPCFQQATQLHAQDTPSHPQDTQDTPSHTPSHTHLLTRMHFAAAGCAVPPQHGRGDAAAVCRVYDPL